MTTATRIPHPRLRDAVEGIEKFCAKCDEWWPADNEFFWGDPTGVADLFYCCKACYREHLDPRRTNKVDMHQHLVVALPSLFGAKGQKEALL